MLRLETIVGSATDPEISHRLHHLEHAGGVEYIALAPEDTHRRRLRAVTDAGTDCAVILERSKKLYNGAVLLLTGELAVVVRMRETEWLSVVPRDAAAALELGYFAGNMHWVVRFDGAMLKIALSGPEKDFLDRLAPMLEDGRAKRVACE